MKRNDTWLKYASIVLSLGPFTTFWISASNGSLKNPRSNARTARTAANATGPSGTKKRTARSAAAASPKAGVAARRKRRRSTKPATTCPATMPTAAAHSIAPVHVESNPITCLP